MDWGCEWRHARKAMGWDFGWFLEKTVSWDLNLDEASWDPNLGESSWVYEMRRTGWGQMEQSA